MTAAPGTFRSLRGFNYRLWAAGALVSNVGTWMQRIAQDWLVLTELTRDRASAVGLVMALQFGPQIVLLPLTGLAADRLDRRRLLFATQASMGALALGLGVLTLARVVALWHVFVFAALLGCVTAFDAPARQTFVADLVGEDDLANAVALNSTSFNAARMIGPALAGLLIAGVGTGWVFVANAASFAAVLIALALLRPRELRPRGQAPRASSLVDGLRYAWSRPALRTVLGMLFLIAAFGLNFPIFISTMAVTAFHAGAGRYGFLTSTMAIGSVCGALLAARRARPRLGTITAGAAAFGVGCAAAALMPHYALFGLTLAIVGAAAQTFTTTANSATQITTEPALRGRVMAIFLAIALGTTPLGAPLVGWIADRFGPRWALGVAAAAGILAALLGWRHLARHGELATRAEAALAEVAPELEDA